MYKSKVIVDENVFLLREYILILFIYFVINSK